MTMPCIQTIPERLRYWNNILPSHSPKLVAHQSKQNLSRTTKIKQKQAV
jgi:hypothetical protein